MALFRRAVPPPPADDEELEVAAPAPASRERAAVEVVDDGRPPSHMRGTEPMYGYLVGLELLVVAVLNLVVTGGAGAPKHPSTDLEYGGLVAAAVFVGLLQLRNRTVTGFAALGATYVVAGLPRVPTRLNVAHLVAIAVSLVYALLITQRQRKATGMSARRGRRGGGRAAVGGGGAGGTRPAAGRSRRSAEPARPAGPQRSARYTPPKAKRATGSRRAR